MPTIDDANPAVVLRLFGGARLESSAEVAIRGRAAHRRRLALLALLGGSATRSITRERAVALLWPDEESDKGRRQLSEALYLIRKELGELAIDAVGESVQLNTDVVACDVVGFRQAIADKRLEEAVASYSGPFLDGWYVDDAPEFERWSTDTREELAVALRGALSELARREESEGAWEKAAVWLTRLGREDPYNGPVAVRFAKALEASGRRAEALRVLTTHVERLQGDLELSPSDDVNRMMEALRSTPFLIPRQASPPNVLQSHPVTEPVGSVGTDSPRFVVSGESSAHGAHAQTLARRRALPIWVGFAGAVIVSLGAVAMWRVNTASSPIEPAQRFDPSHVAVLYFDDHSIGRELGYLAEGLTEELIHQLAEVPALRVVSRNGVKRFREFPATPDSIAELLRAGSLVEGSVQQSRDSLRVTVQLIDGNTGLHVESRTFQRPKAELFEMERDIAASVATALRQRLGASFVLQHLSRGTNSVEALHLVLRARRMRDEASRIALHPHENDSRSAQRILTAADSLLQLAARADPEWSRPMLERGWVQLQRRRLAPNADGSGSTSLAEDLASRVLRREPKNAEAFHLRGVARWRAVSGPMRESADSTRAQTAEADLRAAVALDSTLATAWAMLADVLNVRGAIAEAEVAASRALEQDAWLEGADETLHRAFASNLLLQRYADATRWCLEGQRVYPESWRFYECELTLMREDRSKSPNAQRAWLLVARMDSLDPPERAKATGHAYSPLYRRAVAAAVSARSGDRERARSEIAALRSSVSADSVLALDLLYEEAAVRYELGEIDEARRLIDVLFSARPMLSASMARVPLVRLLRSSRSGPTT